MTSTTSHGSPGSGVAVPPLRREVHVEAGPAVAFDVFTAGIGAWWPLGDFSVHGAAGTENSVAFVGSGPGARIVESAEGEDDAVWGTVTEWEPGRLVAFTWHPGRGADQASKVSVTFEATDHGTLVTLVHTGWEIFGDDAVSARADYDRGWPAVLARYATAVTPE